VVTCGANYTLNELKLYHNVGDENVAQRFQLLAIHASLIDRLGSKSGIKDTDKT